MGLNGEIGKILSTPDMKQRLSREGADSPEHFAAYMKAETLK